MVSGGWEGVGSTHPTGSRTHHKFSNSLGPDSTDTSLYTQHLTQCTGQSPKGKRP